MDHLYVQVALHHATRAIMHLLRPLLDSRVGAEAADWAQRLTAASPAQPDSAEGQGLLASRPWHVMGQLTRNLWHLHCRKQLGISASVLRSQVSISSLVPPVHTAASVEPDYCRTSYQHQTCGACCFEPALTWIAGLVLEMECVTDYRLCM